MNLLIFGATGMVGFEVLHLALVDPRVHSVTTIGRRAAGVQHHKLGEIVHADMLDLSELEPQLRHADLILYCLGVYQNAVTAAEFWTKAKGRAERFLTESLLTRKYIFRPGYIAPGRVASRSTTPEWISRPLFRFLPGLGIEAVNLAKVMLETGLTRPAQVLYTNGEMRSLAANFLRSSGWARSARR